jgi:hypothetical protein
MISHFFDIELFLMNEMKAKYKTEADTKEKRIISGINNGKAV